jgi:hypothetical protein
MPAETTMVTEPKPKAPRKAKRRRKPPEAFVDYIVCIESWDWGYSLFLNSDRHAIDHYHKFRHLRIRGRLLHPKGLKTDRVEITLLPGKTCFRRRERSKSRVARGRWTSTTTASPDWYRSLWTLFLPSCRC